MNSSLAFEIGAAVTVTANGGIAQSLSVLAGIAKHGGIDVWLCFNLGADSARRCSRDNILGWSPGFNDEPSSEHHRKQSHEEDHFSKHERLPFGHRVYVNWLRTLPTIPLFDARAYIFTLNNPGDIAGG